MDKQRGSIQEAAIEGQRAGRLALPASLNPYQIGTPEYTEWERMRFNAVGSLVRRAA